MMCCAGIRLVFNGSSFTRVRGMDARLTGISM